MKKIFIVSLVVIGCMEIFSCASGHRQVDILHPKGGISVTGSRIYIEEFNEKEIVFMIRTSRSETMWLEYVIEDEAGNAISEEAFYHDGVRRNSIRKLKAKEGYEFRKGENYTLYIGITLGPLFQNRFQIYYKYKFVL